MTAPKPSGQVGRYEHREAVRLIKLHGPGPKLDRALNALVARRKLWGEEAEYILQLADRPLLWEKP